jgi:hypothetical protein
MRKIAAFLCVFIAFASYGNSQSFIELEDIFKTSYAADFSELKGWHKAECISRDPKLINWNTLWIFHSKGSRYKILMPRFGYTPDKLDSRTEQDINASISSAWEDYAVVQKARESLVGGHTCDSESFGGKCFPPQFTKYEIRQSKDKKIVARMSSFMSLYYCVFTNQLK